MKPLFLMTLFFFYLYPLQLKAMENSFICLPSLVNNITFNNFDENIKLVDICQQQTQYTIASKVLEKLFHTPSLSSSQKALLLSYESDIHLLEEDIKQAKDKLDKALSIVENISNNSIKAHVYSNYANYHLKVANYAKAEKYYEQAMSCLTKDSNPLDYIKIHTNLIKLSIKTEKFQKIEIDTKKLFEFIVYTKTIPIETKLYRQITILELLLSLIRKHHKMEFLDLSKNIVINNLQLVIKQNLPSDNFASILSYGYLGELLSYPVNDNNLWKSICTQAESQYHCAKKLLQQTVLKLNYSRNQEITYYWEWKYGQLLESNQEIELAKEAYIHAVDSLQKIKGNLLARGSRDIKSPFKRHIEPVYKSLIQLYLQQGNVLSALEIMEKMNNEKLQAFYPFDNCHQYAQSKPCIELNKTSLTPFSQLASNLEQGTAFFYPIFFEEHIELIVILPSVDTKLDIRTVKVNIPRSHIEEQVNILRRNIEPETSYEFEPDKYLFTLIKLGEWLIEPIHPILQKHQIKTLIIVPESNMYMIPISTLIYKTVKNGNTVNTRVLNDYATVITPSLNILFDNTKHTVSNDGIENLTISLNGLSKKSIKFPEFRPLPHVEQELQNIQSIFGVTENTILLNEHFSSVNMEKNLTSNNYRMLHIASHGKFNRNPLKTFILTNSEKLDLNRFEWLLKKKNRTKLDLLTLSACETAKGDDLSAFGLAGMAYKTGAKTVLATLWPVRDETTTYLMTSFYQKLKCIQVETDEQCNSQSIASSILNKAQILQQVQQELVKKHKYPMEWAPFILIGNWK